MSQYIEPQEFIPKSEIPAEMPKGIAIKYYVCWPDDAKEITTGSLRRILKNLCSGKWKNIFLTNNDNLEKNFMQLESGNGLYALQFVQDNTGGVGDDAAWFSTYDLDYLMTNISSIMYYIPSVKHYSKKRRTAEIASAKAIPVCRIGKLRNSRILSVILGIL